MDTNLLLVVSHVSNRKFQNCRFGEIKCIEKVANVKWRPLSPTKKSNNEISPCKSHNIEGEHLTLVVKIC